MEKSLNALIDTYGFEKINSLTKYPSILTYHQLGPRGGLKDELIEDGFPDTVLEVTEKVDGTNYRCVFLNDDYLFGSRESFVYAKNDRIENSNIIPIMKLCLNSFFNNYNYSNIFTVIYGEVYGYKIQDGSKVYCGEGNTELNFRIFDVWKVDFDTLIYYLNMDINKIISFREHTNDKWLTAEDLDEFSEQYKLQRTPVLMNLLSNELPTSAEETKVWMDKNFSISQSIIGNKSNNPKFARAEGVVIRTLDRKVIRKLRFEDYQKGKQKNWYKELK